MDALIGLAADALGWVGWRYRRHCCTAPPPWRRMSNCHGYRSGLAWVHAELAMATGDGDTATQHARQGVELAQAALPALRRHRVKSDVVLAAALCTAGDRAAHGPWPMPRSPRPRSTG